MAIHSFKCDDTRELFEQQRTAAFAQIAKVALRKLAQLQAAMSVADLRIPPGNMLESLKGNRRGQYSIRINDQFRVCFKWSKNGPEDVEIVDYH